MLRRPQNSAKINTYLRSNAKSMQGVSSQGEVFPHCLQRRKSLIFNPYHGIFSFVLSSIHVDRFEKRMFPVRGIPRTEYDALIESAYFPVHEVMGLSPISLDPFLNGVPCSQFRGTRFRATWLPNRQIFHGFHLPCREEGKSVFIKTKSGCLRYFPRTSAFAFYRHRIIIFA